MNAGVIVSNVLLRTLKSRLSSVCYRITLLGYFSKVKEENIFPSVAGMQFAALLKKARVKSAFPSVLRKFLKILVHRLHQGDSL